MLQVCGVSYAACYGAKRLFLPSIGPLKITDGTDANGGAGHTQAKKRGVRDKLPSIFRGPIDGLFPSTTKAGAESYRADGLKVGKDAASVRSQLRGIVFLGNMILSEFALCST
jgi:hypothetical protein